MRMIASIALLAILCLSAGLWFSPNSPTNAKPSEPWTYDYAEFLFDPYVVGQKTITIHFEHESYCNLVIYLYNFDNILKYWTINRYTRSGNLTYGTNHSGIWRLECYMSGYLPYVTDETYDLFDLGNPYYPNQNNLGADYTRHPQSDTIKRKAWEIVGDTSSSYEAAYDIYLHVRNNFDFGGLYIFFSTDFQILANFTSKGYYQGNCETDSTILTAYARALGIPARVIYLNFWHREDTCEEHWFAEFYVLNGSEYQWIPVDGCKDVYDWFGIDEANAQLTLVYPYSMGWRQVGYPAINVNFTGSGAYGPYAYAAYTWENIYTNNA